MAADKELNIHLKTTADTAGIQAAEAALKTTTAAQTDSERMVADLEAKRAKARRESEEQSSQWIAEWKQQSVAAREAEIEAIKRVEEEASRAAEAAEQAAAAGVQGVNLQKAAQLKELASQAREIGSSMKAAMDATADGSRSAVEQFDAVAQAGTSAASGIAAGYMAFGPTGAVVVAVLAGLRLVAEMMEEERQKAEKAMADQLAAAKATAEGIRKALGQDQGFDYASRREAVEEDRKARLDEIERAASRAKKDAAATRQVGDLEDEGPDGAEKERRRADREAAERRAKTTADREALEAKVAAERAAAERLDREAKILEQESSEKVASLQNSGIGKLGDEGSKEEVRKRTEDIAATQKELDRVKQALKASQMREAALLKDIQDVNLDRDQADKIGDLRGNKAVDTAMMREAAETNRAEEERRARAQAEVDRMSKQRGGQTAAEVDDFVSGKGKGKGSAGGMLGDLQKAASALKDGATAQELDQLEKVMSGLAGTLLAKDKKDAAQLSRIWQQVQTLQKDLSATDARAKNARE